MAGKYKTRQQSAILDCLMKSKGYVTVSEIEKYLKKSRCSVGLTTIYRHLKNMEHDGIVARINVEKQPGACYQYIANDKDEDSFYIECESCGIVEKMECHQLAELYSHLNADHHFSINPKKTVLYGKCAKCAGESY